MSKLGLKREGGSVVTRQLPRALSSLRVRTNIFHQKILAKGWKWRTALDTGGIVPIARDTRPSSLEPTWKMPFSQVGSTNTELCLSRQ